MSEASFSMRPSSKVPNVSLLATEEHVLHDVEVVAEREVLVDDLDAETGGIPRGVQVAVLPVE